MFSLRRTTLSTSRSIARFYSTPSNPNQKAATNSSTSAADYKLDHPARPPPLPTIEPRAWSAEQAVNNILYNSSFFLIFLRIFYFRLVARHLVIPAPLPFCCIAISITSHWSTNRCRFFLTNVETDSFSIKFTSSSTSPFSPTLHSTHTELFGSEWTWSARTSFFRFGRSRFQHWFFGSLRDWD